MRYFQGAMTGFLLGKESRVRHHIITPAIVICPGSCDRQCSLAPGRRGLQKSHLYALIAIVNKNVYRDLSSGPQSSLLGVVRPDRSALRDAHNVVNLIRRIKICSYTDHYLETIFDIELLADFLLSRYYG
jgi:hypothetical protein